MTRHALRRCAAGLATTVWLAPAGAAASGQAELAAAQALFPEAKPPLKPDGAPRTIALTADTTLELTDLRFAPRPGLSEAVDTTWCGVVLRSAGRPAQGLITIGTNDTEALSCGGLSEAGAVPRDGPVLRIGLVYRTFSPNAAVATPVVLARDPATLTWSIDTSLSEHLAEQGEQATLARIRRDLGSH
jgi:hypothetical protein